MKRLPETERIGAEAYIGIFSYAGMPWQEAERNMKYFTDHVMPSLQSRSVTGNILGRLIRSNYL